MNNFFYDNSDYALFKKALRSTKDEPVIINILSTDSSLQRAEDIKPVQVQRKNMSQKYQASPFDKFFGPRKKRTEPLDMKDFSSWKNKNYRESEKELSEAPEEVAKFSFSDYLRERAGKDKYNDEDKLKSEIKKPIDQLSLNDEDYKRFSLDSYLTKLEQQTKVSGEFSKTEDLIENLDDMQSVVPSSDQDENFGSSSLFDVEEMASESLGGESFAFEREELDKVKNRLEKMEREANNIKEKSTEKVISTNELTDLTKTEEDEFNLDKLGFEDDVEKVNEKMAQNDDEELVSDQVEKPKVEHKKFFEINKNDNFDSEKEVNETDDLEKNSDDAVNDNDSKLNKSTDSEEKEKASQENVEKTDELVDDIEQLNSKLTTEEDKDELTSEKSTDVESSHNNKDESQTLIKETSDDVKDEPSDSVEDSENNDSKKQVDKETDDNNNLDEKTEFVSHIDSSEVLTKTDFKNMTDEIVDKFSKLYKAPGSEVGYEQNIEQYSNPYYQTQQTVPYGTNVGVNGYSGVIDQNQNLQQQQNELQTKIVELIEQNKESDDDIAEKLRLAELEKQHVAEEYENRLKQLEQSIKDREEEAKQQAYIEKLRNDIKLKKAETNYKNREEKIKSLQKDSSEKMFASDKLKSELKNNINVSNLEMDKKLLECVTKLNKSLKVNDLVEEEVAEEEEVQEVEEQKPVRARRSTRTTHKKSTVKSRTRSKSPRRKIDSDIIGGIDFD